MQMRDMVLNFEIPQEMQSYISFENAILFDAARGSLINNNNAV